MEDEKIFSGLVSEMTRWLPDIRHELVNVILLKESIVLCMHVHSMRRLGLSGVWLNMVCFHSSELWNTLELIGFSSVRFKRCGSLGRSNHVGRLDRRGVTRLFFRIQRLYSATSKPRRREGMRDTAVLLRWPWLWFMWPRYEIRDINVFQLPWLLFWMNLDVVTLQSCGLFHRYPSTRHKMSNEWLFIAIIPATLLFCANLAAINLALAVDTETGTNVSFPFIVFTSRSWN